MVGRFDGPRGLVEGECIGKFGGGGERGGLSFGGVVDGGDDACGVGGWGGEAFLVGTGWADGALLCEQGGRKLTVIFVLVRYFDGEV